MKNRTKLALGIALVIFILIVAFVGAYFISMYNIEKNADATAPATSSGEALTMEYNSGGDAPTTSTLVFDGGKLTVSFLASSMYQGGYETTYSFADGVLTIADAKEVKATDISGLAAVIGLPPELNADVNHTVVAEGGGVKITILFNNETLLGEIVLTEAELADLA